MKKEEKISKDSEVNFREQVSYGLGDGATAILGVTIASFSMYYYTDVIGISAAAIGTILFFSRFFDAITNIIMGFIVDCTDSKHGKARPWILWTTIPFALSAILIFSAPSGWSENALLIFVLVTQNLYFLLYTTNNIPYGTLGALITKDSYIRNNLNIFRMLAYFGISLIIPAITFPLINLFGGGAKSWQVTMSIYAIVSILIFAIVFFQTKERVKPAIQKKEAKKPSIIISLKVLLSNKYWLILFMFMIFGWTILGFLQGAPVYYAAHIMGNNNLVGLINGFFTVPLLIGFLLVPFLTKLIGRKKTLSLGLILVIIGSLLIAISPSSLWIVSSSSFIRSIGFAPIMGSAYAMLADTIDYGEWMRGVRNDGLVYSGGTFATTLGGGIASGGIGWFLGLAGYVPGNGNQPSSVYNMIEFLFIYLPAILGLLMLILLYFYNLDKIHPKIVIDLQKREKTGNF
ncbi:glycoside-pentoside-hexuronide (GPH):cation symporter [Mammaliicoccus lentus]|uniref:MFS transporter n=1 Tax=Mammaliicoccus lentus TaxID=42858 RepID=UPI00214CD9C0|nr:glycoside-pentoside-hexuronide (GPH):cation symporter [Mammaliicoccus lentus]MCR1871774.1 glycoside-pentoside-hexuronide (GPH):cation symporter [Mammaliicoccus lentus]